MCLPSSWDKGDKERGRGDRLYLVSGLSCRSAGAPRNQLWGHKSIHWPGDNGLLVPPGDSGLLVPGAALRIWGCSALLLRPLQQLLCKDHPVLS